MSNAKCLKVMENRDCDSEMASRCLPWSHDLDRVMFPITDTLLKLDDTIFPTTFGNKVRNSRNVWKRSIDYGTC